MSHVLSRPQRPDPADVSHQSKNGMISTSHPAATEAGLAALVAGGSAVDSYLSAALVQTAVEPTMTSLTGTMLITVLDPVTGQSQLVSDMGGLPAAEDAVLDDVGRWTGRTVMRPGWVRAAHAGWDRWGRLPWAHLFAPAIAAAREGFEVDPLLWGWMFEHRMAAGSYSTGRDLWFPGGRLVGPGELLRQPALADTLTALAEEGPSYMYEGDFAQRYVATARATGGRLTLDDMAAGSVNDVVLPALQVASGYYVHTCGPLFALMLNLVAVGGVADRDLPSEDPETLYLMMRIVEESWHYGLTMIGSSFRFASPEEMLDGVSVANAERLWRRVVEDSPRPFDSMNLGTNAISVVDADGMVAHGTHSSTSTPFRVGLSVDGVVMTRNAVVFAHPMTPLPIGWGISLVAVRNGRPVLTTASPSISALQNIFQTSVNVLERGMDLTDSVHQPMFGAAMYPSRRPMVESTMADAAFAHLEQRGLGVTRVSPW